MPPKRTHPDRSELESANFAAKRRNVRNFHCWLCHQRNANVPCTTCVRAYHSECLGSKVAKNQSAAYQCEACVKLKSANSSAASKFTTANLNRLLQFLMKRLFEDDEFSRFSPNYFADKESAAFIIYMVDLNSINAKVNSSDYVSTVDFLNDIKWIHHNVSIVAADNADDLRVTKRMEKFCMREIYDIEMCHECYDRSNSMDDWFTKVCDPPHLLVWARVNGHHHYAPAKVLGLANANRSKIDVRFFDDHEMASIFAKRCYLYSEESPNVKSDEKIRLKLIVCLEEVQQYLDNIRAKYSGAIAKFEPKTRFEVPKISQYLTNMIPGLKVASDFTLTAKPAFLTQSVPRKANRALRTSVSHEAIASDAGTEMTPSMTPPETPPATPTENPKKNIILDLSSSTLKVVFEKCKNPMLTDEHVEQLIVGENLDSDSGSFSSDHLETVVVEDSSEDDSDSNAPLIGWYQYKNRNESAISIKSELTSHAQNQIDDAMDVTENHLPSDNSDVRDDHGDGNDTDNDLPLLTIANMAIAKETNNTSNDQVDFELSAPVCQGSDVELSAPLLVALQDHQYSLKNGTTSIASDTESNSNEVTSSEPHPSQINLTKSNTPESNAHSDDAVDDRNSNASDSGHTSTSTTLANNGANPLAEKHSADADDSTTTMNFDSEIKKLIDIFSHNHRSTEDKLRKKTQANLKLQNQNKVLDAEVKTLQAQIRSMQSNMDELKEEQEKRIQTAIEAIKIESWCCNCKGLLPVKNICSDCSQILTKSRWENIEARAGPSPVHVTVQPENDNLDEVQELVAVLTHEGSFQLATNNQGENQPSTSQLLQNTDFSNGEINDPLGADLEGY